MRRQRLTHRDPKLLQARPTRHRDVHIENVAAPLERERLRDLRPVRGLRFKCYLARVVPRRQSDFFRRAGRVCELAVVENIPLARQHRAERQMPVRRDPDHIVRRAVFGRILPVTPELKTFKPRAAAGEYRGIKIRIDFDRPLRPPRIRRRQRRRRLFPARRRAAKCIHRRRRNPARIRNRPRRCTLWRVGERLRLREFRLLRLLGLLLRSRRRIKPLQHEFLISDYQNNRQNNRNQNPTRIQLINSSRPLPDVRERPTRVSERRVRDLSRFFAAPDHTHAHPSDYIAQLSKSPSRPRARSHTPQSPRAHTPNNSARIDKPAHSSHGSSATPPRDKSQSRQPQSPAAAAESSSRDTSAADPPANIPRRRGKFIEDRRRRKTPRPTASDHNDRRARRKRIANRIPENFPHSPLHPIPHHRNPDSPRDRDSEPRTPRLVIESTRIEHEMRALEAHASTLEADKFGASMQPVDRPEAQLRAHEASPAAWVESRSQAAHDPSRDGA